MWFRASSSVRHPVKDGVVRREAACGTGCQMIEFTLSKGAVIPMHAHPNEQIGMVIRGRMALTVAGKVTIIEAGDGYSIAPGQEHGAEVLEDSVVIDAFSPPRDDYRG